MNDRALLAILTAIIWSSLREDMQTEADSDDGPDDGAIREAVRYAGDILVEVEDWLKPDKSRVVDAEIVDDVPRRHR